MTGVLGRACGCHGGSARAQRARGSCAPGWTPAQGNACGCEDEPEPERTGRPLAEQIAIYAEPPRPLRDWEDRDGAMAGFAGAGAARVLPSRVSDSEEAEATLDADEIRALVQQQCAGELARLCREYGMGGVGSQTTIATLVELDFGSPGTRTGNFIVADPNVLPQTNVFMSQSGIAATGRSADENELDAFVCRCVPMTGSFVAYVTPVDGGSVSGKYMFQYFLK